MLFLACHWPGIPKFRNISKNYLGTSYESVGTALGRRFATSESCFLAKFRVYRFKDGGDVKFQKIYFSKNPLRGYAPRWT